MKQTGIKISTIIAIITAAMSVMLVMAYAQTNPSHSNYEQNCDMDCNDDHQKYLQNMNSHNSCNMVNTGTCKDRIIEPA